MTINCISTERIWKDWGDWWMASLESDRVHHMMEAAKAEICSKQQNMMVRKLSLNKTTSIEWRCSSCMSKIHINMQTKRARHWKDFLCDNCKGAKWHPQMLRNLSAFHSEIQKRLKTNIKTNWDYENNDLV